MPFYPDYRQGRPSLTWLAGDGDPFCSPPVPMKEKAMAIELRRIIAEYFEADRGKDAEALVRCFPEGAVVRDEGHTYTGRDAIRQWKADSSAKYTYTVEPFAMAAEGDRTVVTSHLAGDFPGS